MHPREKVPSKDTNRLASSLSATITRQAVLKKILQVPFERLESADSNRGFAQKV